MFSGSWLRDSGRLGLVVVTAMHIRKPQYENFNHVKVSGRHGQHREASGSISFDLETSGAHGSISFSQLSCSKTGKPSGPLQHVLLLSTAGELLLSSMYPTSFMYFRGRSSESLGSRVVYGRRDSDIGFGVYWHQHSVRKLLYLRKLSNDGAPKARSRLTLAAPR